MKIFNIKVKTLANLFGIVWVGSIISSIGLVYAAYHLENGTKSDFIGNSFITTVIIGVLSFALAVVFYFLHFVNSDNTQVKKKTGKKKNNEFANIKHGALVSSVVGLSIIGILLLVALLAKGTSIISGASMEQASMPSIEATDTPVIESPTPFPVYVPPAIPTQVYIAPTIDPDPPVLCNISANCGGGTTPLRQSECANSTCCQIGNNWVFYKDKNQCVQDQNAYWANYYKNDSNYTAPTNNYVPSTDTTQPTQQPQQPVVDPNQAAVEVNNVIHSPEYCKAWGLPATSKFCQQ